MSEVENIPRAIVEPYSPFAAKKSKMGSKKNWANAPIGVFDSGVGGLTVLSELNKELPNENIVYLADTKNVPFGSKPKESILKINRKILDFFAKQEVKMVVMACGTSSAIAYPKYKDDCRFSLISMIAPGSMAALKATKNNKIGILATQNTVDAGAFQNELLKRNDSLTVVAEGCPLFVPLVEGGFIQAKETETVAKEYLKPLINHLVDTIILGCTHYPHLIPVLKKLTDAELVDPAHEVALAVRESLSRCRMFNTATASGNNSFYVTADPHKFEDLGSHLLNKPVAGVKLVELV